MTTGFIGEVGSTGIDATAILPDGRIVVISESGTVNPDFSLACLNSDGSLDENFGVGGKVSTEFGGRDRARALAVQGDGKIVVVGSASNDIALARYLGDGRLDTSFGVGGLVRTGFAEFDVANDVAIQADGKIVVAGSVGTWSDRDFVLLRYHGDGTLDTSLGGTGWVTTKFSSWDQAYAVAIQTDGRIVVAGRTQVNYDFAVARYMPDGSLDPTFDSDGKVTVDFGSLDYAYALAIQGDGKIVVGGRSWINLYLHGYDFSLARLNSDGSLDTSFGGDGRVSTDFGGWLGGGDEVQSLAIQADGRIVAGGAAYMPGTEWDFAVARYRSDGSLDSSFGGDGRVTTDFGRGSVFVKSQEGAYGLALQADGKFVLAGVAGGAYGGSDVAVARYLTDGSLDPGFDSDGLVTIQFHGQVPDAAHDVVALQADGKLIVVGESGGHGESVLTTRSSLDFALARYQRDGSLDASFGGDGRVTIDIDGGEDHAQAIAVQNDGKIVVAGYTSTTAGRDEFALVRLDVNGVLDPSFGSGGVVRTGFGASMARAFGIAIQGDGKIVAVGTAALGNWRHALARYNVDGSLDTSFGINGMVTTDLYRSGSSATAVAIQGDGKIVVSCSGIHLYTGLTRYNTDGSLDAGFGSGGTVQTKFGLHSTANALAIQGDGKIVVAGHVYSSTTTYDDFLLARFHVDGTLDTTFGSSGATYTDFDAKGDRVFGVAIQGDGRIVAVGRAAMSVGNYDFALARYESDGSLDTSFGTAGKVHTNFERDDEAHALAIQADGKIVAVGKARTGTGGDDFALARYEGLSSLQMLVNLIRSVEDLAAALVLNHGQARSLLAKLTAALQQYDRGLSATAIEQLGAFQNEVAALVSATTLAASQGAVLYESAAYIILFLSM